MLGLLWQGFAATVPWSLETVLGKARPALTPYGGHGPTLEPWLGANWFWNGARRSAQYGIPFIACPLELLRTDGGQ